VGTLLIYGHPYGFVGSLHGWAVHTRGKAIVNRGLVGMMERDAGCPSSMRPIFRSVPRGAFTLLECLVVLAVVCVLAVFFLRPTLSKPKGMAQRIQCVNNLKQVGLSIRVMAIDNGGSYYRIPRWYQSPEVGGESAPFLEQPSELWRYFAAHSNALETPKFLACPSDTRRSLLGTWDCVATNDRNRALSYTLGLDSQEELPDTILSSDRNLSLDGLPVGLAVMTLRTNSPVGFHTDVHNLAGNVLMGDTSVQQHTTVRLREVVRGAIRARTNSVEVRIVVP
jgi:prepilin-type N-terminal cleavage/methylation domain-containing protein